MRSIRRRIGAVILTTLAVSLTTVVVAPVTSAAPVTAHAQDPVRGGNDTEDPEFVHLSIDEVTPSSITTSSEPTVTVEGTVRNIGDRPVEEVNVRLQRAAEITESPELRTVLTAGQSRFDTVGLFETVSQRLDEGETEKFAISLPLRSDTGPSLQITEPGVYPLMVNVNGTPEYGGAARLDDARFLLPVLGVPGTPAVPPDISSPVGMTMLWPLAAEPKLAAGVPGSINDPVRLVDDQLAKSLADGGRLEELVSAVEFATREGEDRELIDSLCLAVDPDLLITVENMTRGYLVVNDPRNPKGPAHEGAGRDAAARWLERVQALAQKMCTTSLPFAQVDLAALSAIGNPKLTAAALHAPADIVDNILGVSTLRNLVWSDSGVMNTATTATIRREKDVTALIASNAVAAEQSPPKGDKARLLEPAPAKEGQPAAGAVDALLFEPAVGAALAAVGDIPQIPSYAPSSSRYNLASDSDTARRQDALGAISWSALNPPEPGSPAAPRSLMIVPPQLWTAEGGDAAAILAGVSSLLRSGLATPRPLKAAIAQPPDLPGTTELDYPHRAREDGTSEYVRLAAAEQLPRIESFQAALVPGPQGILTPAMFTAPLREDLLRAMSLAHRRDRERARAEEASRNRTAQVRDSIDHMAEEVRVVSPGGVYTLASEESPLLLVARNDLPVGIDVRLHVDAPSGVKITDIGTVTLPPRGSRTLTVPARIDDTRKLEVQFSLTTADGRPLGEPTTATVRSNAYGQALAILTGCAGGLLLLLAGRRLWHRFRGQPDRADEGYERS